MSIDFRSTGHSGDESNHYYRQATAPTVADPLQPGDLWSDTTANRLKRCTSVSPITFVSVEGGSAAHDILSATHDATDPAGAEARGDLIRRGAATWERVALGAAGQKVVSNGTDSVWADDDLVINFIIDGGGSAISTGVKGFIEIPFAMTIEGWTILADVSGSIVVDAWKDTYANFPPTVADTIAGTEKPTLVSVQKNQDLTLTTWTIAVAAGDVLAFNVDSATTVTRVTVAIRGRKT